MSFLNVYDFFRSSLSGHYERELEKPYDGENVELVSGVTLWQSLRRIDLDSRGNQDLTFVCSHDVWFYFANSRDESQNHLEAVETSSVIISTAISPQLDVSAFDIISVQIVGVSFDPFDETDNDNITIAKFSFEVRLSICL